ncbi:MAG: phenylacetate--CoA ligase family protein [Methyloligellaceae bacterium]
MSKHYDNLEIRDQELREQKLFTALPELIKSAKEHALGWAELLKDIAPSDITTRKALSQLPVLRKSELADKQKNSPPLGGFSISDPKTLARLFTSPGSIYEPEGHREDWWRTARALFAAGFRQGDIIHNAFSYHLTPGGFILDAGARSLGCPVIPAGVGNTDMQVEAINHIKPAGYSGTPDFLKVLLDKAGEKGLDTSSITKALVSGAALPPSLRQEFAQRGISALQAYITADVGLIAYETEALEGMVLDENIILEIVTPGTGEPVLEGEVGEVLVTSFNQDFPMIRYATGDLSAVLPGTSPCGRTNTRIKGWMGRADQTAKVKGLFIHPSQVAAITKAHPELGRSRIVITRQAEQDVMTFEAECSQSDVNLISKVNETLQTITSLKGQIKLLPAGTIPADGRVIIDEREY